MFSHGGVEATRSGHDAKLMGDVRLNDIQIGDDTLYPCAGRLSRVIIGCKSYKSRCSTDR